MAEVLGAIASSLTLAALFKGCIEAFDLIQTSRHQEVDLKKLKLRLNIEKCRLYIWGESMGLSDTNETNQERPIDTFRFPDVVREILEVVYQLFHDSHKIRDKYGCRSANIEELDHTGPIDSLASTFSNFTVRSAHAPKAPKVVQKLSWIIYDRKKFGALIAEVKDLVDSLQGITRPSVSIAHQAGTMKRRIERIRDAETLSLIAEVCSEDHPDIADAASTKADTISLASTHQRQVMAWTEGVQDGQPTDRMSPDLESLTVTELKHVVLQLRQEAKKAPQELSDPPFSAPSTFPPPITFPWLAPITPEPSIYTRKHVVPNANFNTGKGDGSFSVENHGQQLMSVDKDLSDRGPTGVWDAHDPSAPMRALYHRNTSWNSATSASVHSITSYCDNTSYADSVSGFTTEYPMRRLASQSIGYSHFSFPIKTKTFLPSKQPFYLP